MGRPEVPLSRDGSPVRELAFWLRDLRNRSGLTYDQLARRTTYSISTLQEAASGRRLPTLNVIMAIVAACKGDESAWRSYWSQLKRLIDRDLPPDQARSVVPPWVQLGASEKTDQRASEGEDWYTASFTALVRLDVDPVEAVEQRTIVALVDGLDRLDTSISVPRHREDDSSTHSLDVELMHGGALELQEQPFESYFRNVIALAEPLQAGQGHDYALRLRVPPGQPMAPHYVYVPLGRCDHFALRIRFGIHELPRAVWELSGTPTAVIYERGPGSKTLTPDRFGEVHVEFHNLRQGLGYGVCWQEY